MSDTLAANEPRYFITIGARGEGKDPFGFEVVSFEGSEGISELYQYKIELCTEERDIDFSAVVGKEATFRILAVDKSVERYVCGIIRRLDLVGIDEKDTANKKLLYSAYLVPPQYRATLRRNMRIFQNKNVLQVVTEILADHGLEVVVGETIQKYVAREFCVQYRETDMEFISRLLVEEGIAYHFQHSAGGVDMVLTDFNSAFKPITSPVEVMYHPIKSMNSDQEFVNTFSFGQQMRTGKVELRDYNFKAPATLVEGAEAASGPGKEPQLDHYDFLCDYDGEFKDSNLIQRLAGVRLQELETEYQVGQGYSDCARFSGGAKFILGNEKGKHPRQDLEQEYLIFQFSHWGTQEQAAEGGSADNTTYHNKFTVIPAATSFRPPRAGIVRPMALGIHTARVLGPGEVRIDEYGRIRVQFHWERNRKESFWIRVSQNWAGAGWGGVFHPRKDQEVLVSFIEGDPDRPIITGRVYNQENLQPYPDPDTGATKSTVKSQSSPGGPDNYNELRFEDKKGEEQVYLQAEKDMQTLVKNNRDTEVKVNETTMIGADHKEDIGANETRTVGQNRTLTVTNASTHNADTITLEGTSMITIKVGASTIVLTPDGIKISNLTSACGAGGGATGAVEIKGTPIKLNCE